MKFRRTAEPDYQLVIPRRLFVEESAKLLNTRHVGDWDERCALLLEDAFVRGYEGGPMSEFREIQSEGVASIDDPWGSAPIVGTGFTRRQRFLKDLMSRADELSEDPPRRPYWRERKAGERAAAALDATGVAREYVALVQDLERAGYLEKRFGKDCVDTRNGDAAEFLIERELGLREVWPLDAVTLAEDLDVMLEIIEFLHDHVARPTNRDYHDYGECGWHHRDFDIGPGREVYRWRVNRILERSDLGLQLACEGEDVGRLVSVTDDARADLVHAIVIRDEPADQVRHALALFRRRGADRNEKRSAVNTLALVLEERRHNVLEDVLASSDRGALFEIANRFHIRHQNSQQRRDYDDFYLDWIFWWYLATIELTNRVIDQQQQTSGERESTSRSESETASRSL